MAGNGTSAAAGDSIGPSARAAMVVLVLALHVGGSWALLRHAQRVDRAGTVTPIELSFIVPPAPVPAIVPPQPVPQPAPVPPLAEPPPPLPVPAPPVAQPPEPQPRPRPRPKPVRAKRKPPPAPPVIASATHTPEPAAMPAPPAPVALPPPPPLPPPLPPAAPAVAAAPPPPPPPPAPRDVAITAVQYLTPPVLDYPLASRRMQEHGRVQVRVLVDVQGRPREFQIVRSSGFARLDAAALATVRATRFKPYTEDGKPRPFWVLMPLVFELES